ncbi:MAG: hypothetical protein IIZ17_03220 [Eubacteriaceae bacterium]|nr:hypothetical protein [Eubacteriaceae bacterium]
MLLTLQLSLALMLALCLLVYAATALIQDRRLFTTAPKDIQAAAKDHPPRFWGARALGWKLAFISVLVMAGAFLYAAHDGIVRGFLFRQHFARFITMLYLWKAFDIICLDWLLLTKTHFFQHFYPETEGCEGYHQFGFNRREQLARIIIFPFIAALMAAAACMLGGSI